MLYAIKDAANMQIISQATGKPVLYANYALTSSIDFTANSVYAMNKSVKSVRFDSQREGTFKTEMEVFETKWLAMLFGTTLGTGAIDIAKREVIAVNAGGAGANPLSAAPKSGSLVIFKIASKGETAHDTEQVSGNPTTTQNAFSIDGSNALTFNATTFASAGFVVCYYLVNSANKTKFTVDNVSFPGGYKIYADSAIRGTDQVDKFVQYQLLNVKPKSNVSLTMDVNNVAKLSIEWDILADNAGDMMNYVEV
jgi:hypothetical protein